MLHSKKKKVHYSKEEIIKMRKTAWLYETVAIAGAIATGALFMEYYHTKALKYAFLAFTNMLIAAIFIVQAVHYKALEILYDITDKMKKEPPSSN